MDPPRVLMSVLLFGLLTTTGCDAEGIITVPMEEECGHDVSLISRIRYQARVTLTDADDGETPWFPHLLHNCRVDVKGWYVWPRLMIFFEKFNLNCSDGHIALFDGKNEYNHVKGLPGAICGSIPSGVFTTESRILRIKYYVKSKMIKGDIFSLIVTAFQDGENCPSYAHECANGRCIDEEIRCNGHNSCGDGSDCRLTTAVIAGIVIGSLTGATITLGLIVACVCCLRPSKRQKRYEKRPVYQREVSTYTCDSEDGCVQPAVTSLSVDPSTAPVADINGTATAVRESGDFTASRKQTNDSSLDDMGKLENKGTEQKTHAICGKKEGEKGTAETRKIIIDVDDYKNIHNNEENQTKSELQNKLNDSKPVVVLRDKTNGHAVCVRSTKEAVQTTNDHNKDTSDDSKPLSGQDVDLVNDQAYTQRL